MNCSFTEKISSLIDGELSTAEAREVERHMPGCNDCQQLRADFLSLRSQIAGFETSLQPEVQNRALKKILGTERPGPARGLRWSFGAPAVAFATLVIAAAIVGLLLYQSSNKTQRDSQGIASVNQTPSPAQSGSGPQSKQQQQPEASPEPSREQPTQNKNNDETPRRQPSAPKRPIVREPKPGEQFAAVPGPVRSADAQTLTAMHFEKSETLLLAFRNVRLNEPGTATEVGYERKRAQQLVYQNMMLRREADTSGDVQISSLLESLEPILIDIANLPEHPDEDAVRVIRERVERKNIVPLLRVNSTALARALD
ncbi:MAG TPA: zf-HC2 domain-containing protein [Pyrinomonadaceae bacterium]|jgi:negative regulator of sigma E activity|nr:zf-HC2 domain-containing protein [Pyrinomonadaceae bacterium]